MVRILTIIIATLGCGDEECTTDRGMLVELNRLDVSCDQIDTITDHVVNAVVAAKGYTPDDIDRAFGEASLEFVGEPWRCGDTDVCGGFYNLEFSKMTVVANTYCLHETALAHEEGHLLHDYGEGLIDYTHADKAMWNAIADANREACKKVCPVCLDRNQLAEEIRCGLLGDVQNRRAD
jgi:hypothetical protein